MERFVFSCDGHILEPSDIFLEGLPASMRDRAIVSEKKDDYILTHSGDVTLHRVRILPGGVDLGRKQLLGHRDLAGRKKDMAEDGVDAELVFPSLGLWTFMIPDADVELAHAETYNNWAQKFFAADLDTFVPAAILPVRDFSNTLSEMRRAAAMGFTTMMLPSATPKGIPPYNSELWDPIFHQAGEMDVVFTLHTGTGLDGGPVMERGAGGAVINYTRQMLDSQNTTMYLVGGGVLDRNPKSRVAFVESGASWLGAVAERMDEVYEAHAPFVKPKLTRKPSEVVRDQVKASFQHDRECILGRRITGHQAVMWAADYPHAEGTFPHSRKIIEGLFEGIDITEDEKADIIGRTAAKFYGLKRPEYQRQPAAA